MNLSAQEPFYNYMVFQLSGKKGKKKVNGESAYLVKCPHCGCSNSALITSRNKDTYLFICPNVPKNNGTCHLGKLTLHQLINRYGSTALVSDWIKARKKSVHGEWFPIKNRKCRGKSQPPSEPVKGLTDEIGRLRVKGML